MLLIEICQKHVCTAFQLILHIGFQPLILQLFRYFLHPLAKELPPLDRTIGDQVFTDVFGSNRAGLYSILVKPIAKKEEIQIVFKRYLERVVLFFYKRQLQS